MTTKPKAKKFRIRKSSPLASAAAASDGQTPANAQGTPGTSAQGAAPSSPEPRQRPVATVRPAETGRAPTSDPADRGDAAPRPMRDAFPAAAARKQSRADTPPADIDPPSQVAAETDLAAIRKEGLTGRQLRMARRLAQKHDIAATSDFDAVRQLRKRGIDPFERATMLELVVPDARRSADAAPDKVQLPQTVARDKLPATETDRFRHERGARRTDEIQAIQRDIAKRRRRKLALLTARLAFFVALPTLIAGYYYFKVATPMYATQTEFVIQQAEASGGGGLGGLFSGTGFATSQDSIAVQSYLMSRDAMMRLNEDADFRAHFSQDFIDPIQRLPEDASMEQTYAMYEDVVEIGYDPTEGIVKMEVIAADPQTSAEYSRRLIDYAEERVDNLTQRLRGDQMADARASFDEAEAKMLAAQNRVLELQERLGVLDPAAESGSVMGQITTFETQLREKQIERQSILANRRPNQARLAGVEGEIQRLQAVVDDLRSQMTDGSGSAASLARVSAELRIAETDLATRTTLMQQALQQLETARLEANRQTRYLSLGVTPVAPDEPSYPRAFENTLLAFLVFAGLYLLLSLTASILREQVSA
ncbi:capsular polysaccharide transport system permease protein [Palleronia salina]|uniref:Capsular polysaccharide transport system permease protein n=1 Tax=Palleronia salina TaxID=313368 RepID=A0A1M6GD89_9RHOB|nr:capsule biosynthesis protein [Palleronia salina]SHJ07907.1 capsular polysaccharide transport system permease protein [Palleronia salina]